MKTFTLKTGDSTFTVYRVDDKGRVYRANVRQRGVISIQTNSHLYAVKAMETSEDVWYGDTFLGTQYAVFSYHHGFWQQCSNWFHRQGYAVKTMKIMAGYDEKIISEAISDIERTYHE